MVRYWKCVALTLIIATVSAWVIPFEGDEFYQYHALFCRYYPWNRLNTFMAGCGEYDLRLTGTDLVLPLRAYLYSGSFPSLYYLPLFLLWPSPISARWLNLLFLLAESVVLGRIFQFDGRRVFYGLLLFFPYAFQHVVDTGPVSLHLLSVFVIYALAIRWCRSLHLVYPILIASVIVACIWTKLVYLLLLPGIAVLVILAFFQSGLHERVWQGRRRFWLQLILGIALTTGMTSMLLFSSAPLSPDQYPLIEELQRGGGYSLTYLYRSFWNLGITQLWMNPLSATHRIYEVSRLSPIFSLSSLALFFGISWIILTAWITVRPARTGLAVAAILYLVFLGTTVLVIRTKVAWGMHHLILVFPFLILAILTTISALRRTVTGASLGLRSLFLTGGVLLGMLNAGMYAYFPFQQKLTRADPSKMHAHTLLSDPVFAQRYFYVVLDHGMYFFQALYGPRDQSVLYVRLNSREKIRQLELLAKQHKRQLLFLANVREPVSDLHLLRSALPLIRCKALPTDAVWQIFYEKSPVGDHACRGTTS